MAGKGGPPGNKYASAENRLLSSALKRELAKAASKGVTKAQRIAERAVLEAMDGQPWAQQLVFDRTEGRPAQAIALSGDPDNDVPVSLVIRGK